jgi:hypothetical protein
MNKLRAASSSLLGGAEARNRPVPPGYDCKDSANRGVAGFYRMGPAAPHPLWGGAAVAILPHPAVPVRCALPPAGAAFICLRSTPAAPGLISRRGRRG